MIDLIGYKKIGNRQGKLLVTALVLLIFNAYSPAVEKTVTVGGAKEVLPEPATVYRCHVNKVDIYTNTKISKNCKWLSMQPYSTPDREKNNSVQNNKSDSSGGFPKVLPSVQQQRDQDRKRILQEELRGEQRALEQAKIDLSSQEKNILKEEKNYQKMMEKLKPYKNKIFEHERNVSVLKKELLLQDKKM